LTELRLTAEKVDLLREIGNIGAGHAATALSQLLASKVTMVMPSARVCSFDEIADVAGGAERIMAGAYIRVEGEFCGNFVFLLGLESARRLLHSLLPGAPDGVSWGEFELSTLGEVANILCGSYVTAITQLTQLDMRTSVPAAAVDMVGAILDIALLDSAAEATEAVVIETRIRREVEDVDGHLVLLPDPGAMTVLLRAVGCDGDD
jgi:chemotaxis protein CheC